MTTIEMMPNLPERDPSLSRDRIAKVIEEELRLARALVEDLEEALNRVGRSDGTDVVPIRSQDDFRQLRPLDAALKLLHEQRNPIKRSQLEARLENGHCFVVNPKEAMKAIRAGLSMAVTSGSLKEVNGKIGLPDWPNEKFE